MEPVDLTRRLVALPSAGGGERPAAELAAEVLDAAGWDVRLLSFERPDRAQLIAVLGEPRPGALAFCGHLDTVPASDEGWSHDPFGGEVSDGRIYGRGTSDMKGGVAAIIVAATRLAATPARAAGTTIVLTADEETGARGARALLVEAEIAALGALVVAEPTDNELRIGHRGALWLALQAHGRAAHASTPEAGENALTRMRAALDAIEAAEIAAGPPDPLLGVATLAVTGVRAGAAVNVIPDRAEATIDIRTNSALTAGALVERLRAAAGADIGVDVLADVPALRGDDQGRLAQALRSAGAGHALIPTVPFFTDAGALQRPGLEVAIVGPGNPGLAHQVDEWCSVERLDQAVDLFEAVALRWNREGDRPRR